MEFRRLARFRWIWKRTRWTPIAPGDTNGCAARLGWVSRIFIHVFWPGSIRRFAGILLFRNLRWDGIVTWKWRIAPDLIHWPNSGTPGDWLPAASRIGLAPSRSTRQP